MCEDLVWPPLSLLLLLLLRLSPASTAAPGRESVNQQQLLQPYPAGVDLFEHEFTSVSADDFDPFGPDIGNDDLGIDDPETMPRLFQGDIAIDPYTYITLRLGVNPMRHPKRLWPNGTIPFEISPRYDNRERNLIVRALKTFNSLTCIRFTPYDGEVEDYLLIEPPEDGPQGCWSYVGKRGGEQVVALQQPDETSAHCFSSEGRIMHELMHAIGIYHEQSRADRDNFVKIHWDNIVPRFKKNFKLVSRKRGKYAFDYDYNSVMHYGEYYFSKKKGEKPTMTPLQPGVRIGQRKTISKIDCLKINDLYGCLKGRRAKMYKSFCHLLGL
ncbi:PREDICTED: low choriolytic enzyme [Drosophila arizonae]|uniref:Metalloendopeptidase n=1 Tax=Drosophila arizonae TaxID=7263 RepID=A0ABM1P3S1_DROAR|nr:PREDICTED: low choriolytic enzyme [Drosophila arizonae]